MRIRFLLWILLASIVLWAAVVPLGAYPGHDVKALASIVLYFVATWFFLNKSKSPAEKWMIIFLLFLTPGAVYLPLHILYEDTALSFPSTMSAFIGILFGALMHYGNRYLKWLTVALVIFSSTWICFWGYPLWLNKINYGTFTGSVNIAQPATLSGKDQNGRQFANENFKNKIILLDFWHTACGVCFQKFPILQKTYNEYKSDSSIAIFAVNTPLQRDTVGQAFAVLKELNYDFPILISKDSLYKHFNVEVYPTTYVINRNGIMVFKGEIEGAAKILKNLSTQR